jgi:uncharacterized protein YbaR (Trm112 family)
MGSDSSDADLNALRAWADQFACPSCGSSLHFNDTHFICSGCARGYPIAEGIPVLIKDRATLPARPS